MLDWLKEQWRLVRASYDPDVSLSACSPMAILLGPGVFALAVVVFSLIPSVGLKDPWLPLALVAVGANFTHLAWRHRARGHRGALGLFVDNGFYAASFMVVASTTIEEVGIGVAVALALVLLGPTVKQLPSPVGLGGVLGGRLVLV